MSEGDRNRRWEEGEGRGGEKVTGEGRKGRKRVI